MKTYCGKTLCFRFRAIFIPISIMIVSLFGPLCCSVWAAESIVETRPRLVLALSGGGCKAVAEIGVLRYLEQHNIAVDAIVGTSMGATIGALYCSGMPVDKIESLFLSGELQHSMYKGIWRRIVTAPLAPLAHAVKGKPYAGLTTGKSFEKYLAKHLPPTFEQLKIPFASVVTDLVDGSTVVLTKGDLPTAVRASNCVPIMSQPVEMDDHLYVDGGLKANLPSLVAKSFNPDLVLATLVDSELKPVSKELFRSKMQVAGRVADIMLAHADKPQVANSDVLIYPKVSEVPYLTSDADILKAAIQAGEEAAHGAEHEVRERLATGKRGSAIVADEVKISQ
jgi:NTE family protein